MVSTFHDTIFKLCFLFFTGVFLSLLVDRLLTVHNIGTFHQFTKLTFTTSWLPPTYGFSAICLGIFFPLMDEALKVNRQVVSGTSLPRLLGGFLGIIFAASKVPHSGATNPQLTFLLYSVCGALWFLGDRTLHGLLLSLLCAIIGTLITSYLVLRGVYAFMEPDFYGVRSWIPCLLFSGCLCIGTIGRRLQVV